MVNENQPSSIYVIAAHPNWRQREATPDFSGVALNCFGP